MASSPDYSILHAPRITATKFASILRAGHSPAYPEAAACYAAATSRGVDPAVLLAIFRKESTYGRFGRARTNRSWGNLRRSPDYPTVNAFVKYPSWAAGAGDAARLLAIYGRNQIRKGKNTSTVQTMPYVWAPAADGNGPDRYGDQLARWIKEWSGQPGDVAGAVSSGSGAATGSGSGTVGKGTTAATGNVTTVAAYLGVSPDATFDAKMLEQLLSKFLSDYGSAGRYAIGYLRMVYELHVGEKAGTIEWKTNADGTPAGNGLDKILSDPIAAALAPLGETITSGLRDVAVLGAILTVIVLALYRLVR